MTTKDINLGVIRSVYDSNLSVKENLKNVRSCGVNISLSTLYRYIEVIKKIEIGGNDIHKIDEKRIYELLDVSKTIEQNQKAILDFCGEKISTGKLCPILRRKREDLMNKIQQSNKIDEKDVEKFLGEIENNEMIDD